MAKIELYVKTTCPYCIRAKRLLDAKGVEYEAYVVEFGSDRRQEMIQRANGRSTVPQVFIDGKHIGGCDDLFRLESEGRLDQLLAA